MWHKRTAKSDVPYGVSQDCEFIVGYAKSALFKASLPANAPEHSKWGAHSFQKHYYPIIGDFDSGEEFECAQFLDDEAIRGHLKFWVRNLVKTPDSFSLTKIDGRFYPDFVCALPDDTILVVEYKGADRWDTEKVKEDRAIGNLWAELSGGKCRFVMVTNRNWDMIAKAISPASSANV